MNTVFRELPVVRYSLSCFLKYRYLTWELTKREVMDRYSGHLSGIFWVIGTPLFLMGFYVFLFTFIFPNRLLLDDGTPGSLSIYILSGLIPWMTFAQCMNKATIIVTENSGIVKQVVFPLEVLPVASALGSFFFQFTAMSVLFILLSLNYSVFSPMLILVPMLLICQFMAMAGVAYVLSAVGAYFRDIKDIINLVTTAGLFAAPILYLPERIESISPVFLLVLNINPFSHMVWCYQDVFYFGSISHPVSWFIYPFLSLLAFLSGAEIFERVRHLFGNVL